MSDPHTHIRSERAGHEPRAENEHVAELLHAVDARAPKRLHERVQAMVADRGHGLTGASGARRTKTPQVHPSPSRELIAARMKPTLAAMAVAVVVGAAVALLTSGGAQRGPSVSEASALTLRAATMAAPRESATRAGQLDAAVDGVAFPYWQERFGWRATGARTDTVGGRAATTVFYSGPGASRIGYAIVGGAPAPATAGGTIVWHDGVAYRLLHAHGAPVVTWRRDGRLCVLSGRGMSATTLLALAGWQQPATAS